MPKKPAKMSLDDALEFYQLLAERKTFERWLFFEPVPKQLEFFATGNGYIERLLMAGNGNGKTECAAYEVSRHLTGEYPPWWNGRRYDKPVTVWVAGASAVAVRDAAQTKLCGRPGDKEMFGSGFIPKEAFVEPPNSSRSAPNAYESWLVRHKSGGSSRVVVKTYQQEREDWQGPDINILWCDEEPPTAHYSEGLARLRGRGMSMLTFTPLKGPTEVVLKFMENTDPHRAMVRMGIKDAIFYTDEERQNQINSYPAHEREARANGMPLLGEGVIFATPISDLLIPPVPLTRIPTHWKKIWGVDFGIAHPFAAVLLAWDTEGGGTDMYGAARDGRGPVGTVYILASIRMSGAIPLQHADAMKKIAADVPVAWPHDGHERDKGSGTQLAQIYKGQGLKMMTTHATHPTGGFSTEAGVQDLDAYMQARQFKVFENQPEWIQEYSQYHRKDNRIVKAHDDLMSATRIAHIMRRYARPVPLGSRFATQRSVPRLVDGVDFDLFA